MSRQTASAFAQRPGVSIPDGMEGMGDGAVGDTSRGMSARASGFVRCPHQTETETDACA